MTGRGEATASHWNARLTGTRRTVKQQDSSQRINGLQTYGAIGVGFHEFLLRAGIRIFSGVHYAYRTVNVQLGRRGRDRDNSFGTSARLVFRLRPMIFIPGTLTT